MKLQRPDPGIDAAKSGLHGKAGIFFNAGLFLKGGGFNPLDLDPYLLFDAETSMRGTLEAFTLDLDPANPSTLDVITATRAGTATFTDANGLIASAPANTVRVDQTQGAELTPTKFQRVENTDFSTWSHARTSDTANAAISPDGQNNATYVEQNAGQTNAGSIYRFDAAVTGVFTLSVYAKKKEKDFIVLYDSNVGRTYFNLETGTVGTIAAGNTANIEDAGNGWFRCSTTFTASSSGVKAFYVGDTDNSTVVTDGGGIYIYGPQFEEGTTASDFVANTTGSPKFITGPTFGPRVPMILVEPSSENLLPYSEDISNSAWTKFGAGTGVVPTVTPDFGTAPDGTLSASRVQFNKGSGTSIGDMSNIFDSAQTSSGATTSKSVYLKSNTTEAYEMVIYEVTDASGTNVKKITVTPDWQRFHVYGAIASTTTGISIGLREISVSGLSNTADVLVWGAQVEAGSVATSYIPTSGGDAAARTRNADDLVISGSDFTDFFNPSQGTFYIELIDRTPLIQSAYIFGQSVGQYYLYSNSSNNVDSYDGTNFQSLPGVVANELFRAAATFSSAPTKNISLNGQTTGQGSFSSIPETHTGSWGAATILKIGNGYGTLNGYVKRLIFWPTSSDNL